MLASTLYTPIYRTKVAEWLPPAERAKEIKEKHGWEMPNSRKKQGGGWVAKRLSTLLQSKDSKVISPSANVIVIADADTASRSRSRGSRLPGAG